MIEWYKYRCIILPLKSCDLWTCDTENRDMVSIHLLTLLLVRSFPTIGVIYTLDLVRYKYRGETRLVGKPQVETALTSQKNHHDHGQGKNGRSNK